MQQEVQMLEQIQLETKNYQQHLGHVLRSHFNNLVKSQKNEQSEKEEESPFSELVNGLRYRTRDLSEIIH